MLKQIYKYGILKSLYKGKTILGKTMTWIEKQNSNVVLILKCAMKIYIIFEL
jgi:hypothetical protein